MNSQKICCCIAVWLVLLMAFTTKNSHAHELQVEPVAVSVTPQKAFLHVTISGNGEDVIQAADANKTTEIEGEEFNARVNDAMQKYLDERFVLKQGGQKLKGKIESLSYWNPDNLDYTKSRFEMSLRYERDPKLAGKPFQITSRLFDYLPNARTLVSIRGPSRPVEAGQTLEYDPEAVAANLMANIREFLVMGFEHILIGPDHVLFILALLLASSSFLPLVKTLTGFTLAHSLTLGLASLNVFILPEKATEILVALSIVYVGLENVFLKEIKHRFWVASGFGLVHGFGFAYILRERLPDYGLGWSLASFNLGVELGQIAICAVAFPVMLLAKKKFERQEQYGGMAWSKVVTILSWGVVVAGSFWLVERIFA